MKKLLLFVAVAGSVISARADSYTFTPPSKMALDHGQYYTWGIKNVVIPADQQIVGAVLTFFSLDNWANEPNWLYTWLLDSAVQNPSHPGYFQGAYNPSLLINDGKIWSGADTVPGDQFGHWTASSAALIGTYTDLHAGHPENVVYDFSDLGASHVNLLGTLESYIRNGDNFGLGFDPDCHYSYCKVILVITTEPRHVPDGGTTLVLLALGLLAIPGLKRLLRA